MSTRYRNAAAALRPLAAFFALFLLSTIPFASAQPADEDAEVIAATENIVILPEPIGDPIEPINRRLWVVNRGLMSGVVQPSSKVYRVLVPTPLRKGIRNVGRNLGYPRDLVNNMLQERWIGARDETYRFLANSVLGIGGLFDVATHNMHIPESDADFGQTFGVWGWKPRVYLMVPVFGPSNERDALGHIMDGAVNPLSYFPPYSYIFSYGITYNNLSDTVEDYVRVVKMDMDPYYVLRYAWTIKRENRGVDLRLEGEQDFPSLDTLQSVFFTFKSTRFPELGRTRTVRIPNTGHKLPYIYWLQKRKAPLVYVVPGQGSHRLSGGAIALAELLYNEGFSAVCVSSTFNYEFMERAASTALPGYTPVDAHDLHVALTEIDRELNDKYPNRVTSRALMGTSMGGFHSLFIAGTEQTNSTDLVAFDRYVAINAPVDLEHAISKLDNFFRAALDWPADERTAHIEETFLKVAALARQLHTLTPASQIPFNSLESKFLIGLAFRLNLRDIIFVSQLKADQGVLTQPLSEWRREPVYREILQYSFAEYLEKFVTPYYEERGVELRGGEQMQAAVSLRSYESALRRNEKVRLIENANDILLSAEDLDWMRATFGPERLTVFERGGHLGNLSQPEVQHAIIRAVADLKVPEKTKFTPLPE